MHQERNIDTDELERFERAAAHWWDTAGEYGALHDINPVRVAYVDRCSRGLNGRRVLDVACGGGIVSEAMAAMGARVTGIDMGETAIAVARRHSQAAGLDIQYRQTTVESFAAAIERPFDVVTCLELLEHVPRPASVISACAQCVRPGGHVVVATLNRTVRSWFLAIVMAEYVLGIVRRGTHTWKRFLRPAEVARMAAAGGLEVVEVAGLRYIPFLRHSSRCRSTAVNYMMHLRKPAGG